MFRFNLLTVAALFLVLVASSSSAFTPRASLITASKATTSSFVVVHAEGKGKDDDIPDGVAQGPEEGRIPAAENAKKGEKTMESLANQGKTEKKDD